MTNHNAAYIVVRKAYEDVSNKIHDAQQSVENERVLLANAEGALKVFLEERDSLRQSIDLLEADGEKK